MNFHKIAEGDGIMNTIFIAGHARLPSGMAAKNIYETLTITAEIDRNMGLSLQQVVHLQHIIVKYLLKVY